jgi:hypothetical protein
MSTRDELMRLLIDEVNWYDDDPEPAVDAILARYAVVERLSGNQAVNRATVTSTGYVKPFNWMAIGGLLHPYAARETAVALIDAADQAEAADVDS